MLRQEYVSSVESSVLPITAIQWHPEKAAFEFNPKQHIPHVSDAILLTQASHTSFDICIGKRLRLFSLSP